MVVVDPVFSAAERNWRWEVVRRIMARPRWNLEAIIAPEIGDRSYCQYLSQIGGRNGSADIVFPRDPAKAVHAFPGPGGYAPGPVDIRTAIWKRKLSSWCVDGKLVIGEGEGSRSVVDCIKALGLSGAGTRIGIAKLAASRFDAEGLVPSTYLENLRAGLPGVLFFPIEQWGPDSGPIDEAAMIKGPEEQEAIRRCVAVSEKGIATVLRHAGLPAIRQADVWLPTMIAMFEETGEEPGRASISLNVPSNSTLGAPTDEPLVEGAIISEEIEGCFQGYKAQVNHSIFIGGERTAGFEYYQAAMEVVIKLFFDTLAFVIPGKTTCGQFVDYYSALVKKLNAEEREGGVAIHTSGLGSLMRPRLGPVNSRKESDIVLVPGMTFDFKPTVRLKRSEMKDAAENNRTVQIGEHVLITETGYVRLGKRELKPLFTE